MLSEQFDALLAKIGNPTLAHPVFYACPVALRFALGPSSAEVPTFLGSDKDRTANPAYVAAALDRAGAIYRVLPQPPDLLRIDCFPPERDAQPPAWSRLQTILPPPHERRDTRSDDEEDAVTQLYWALDREHFTPDSLLREIVCADLGGAFPFLASSVCFASTEAAILYHVYDDRGADLAAASVETLRPIYHRLTDWLLDNDRAAMDDLFA